MSWLKRIGLFMVLNIIVVVSISAILNVLGVQPYLNSQGLDYRSLMIFCLVWGMAGSLISLALSRQMAKWTMGVQVIDPNTSTPGERWLLDLVSRLSQTAGLTTTPEVGVYSSPEVNAFATGPTRSRSLVAVSSGLMQKMNKEEIEGVLGHEIAHIANGDMVTMTLLQGVVNAFVMFLARVAAFVVAQALRNRDDREGGMSRGMYFLMQFVFEIVFMIAGSMIVAWFSRYREFRADAGGAAVAGRHKMIRALKALQNVSAIADPRSTHAAVKALKISNRRGRFGILFSTHPPLEDRIQRLEAATSF